MDTVRILVQAVPGSGKVRFYTTGKYPSKTVKVSSSLDLFAEFRLYKRRLVEGSGAVVDGIVPNLFQAFKQSQAIPPPPVLKVVYCSICGKQAAPDEKIDFRRAAHERCVKEEGQFSVNMVEPLVGWKGWPIIGEFICSQYSTIWYPDTPVKARCPDGRDHESPADACGCGIYAADVMHGANVGPNVIRGEIYGWGRYVRGGMGWRCQFAYPKNFFIEKEQMEYFEMLKKYHVPIFVHEPLKLYDPSDDGYEGENDEHRPNETNRDRGTDQEPAAS